MSQINVKALIIESNHNWNFPYIWLKNLTFSVQWLMSFCIYNKFDLLDLNGHI